MYACMYVYVYICLQICIYYIFLCVDTSNPTTPIQLTEFFLPFLYSIFFTAFFNSENLTLYIIYIVTCLVPQYQKMAIAAPL